MAILKWTRTITVGLVVLTFVTGSVWAQTQAGNALQFDGVNDLAFVEDNATLDIQGAVTLELWVQLSSRVPLRDQLAVGKRGAYYIYSETATYGGSGQWKGSISSSSGDCFATTHLNVDQWYHLAFTYDGSIEKVFLNGVLENTRIYSAPIGSSGYDLSFGMEKSSGEYSLHGLLDEVRLWNVARSPEDILANYHLTMDPDAPGLVGYWNFDETDGQIILDSTSNENHGVLGASVLVADNDPLRVISDAPIGPEPPPFLGDANGDGVVSAADYSTIQGFFGQVGNPGMPGDANMDGVVSAGDYSSVQANFGNVAPPMTPIPEPATLSLLVLGGVGILQKRRCV